MHMDSWEDWTDTNLCSKGRELNGGEWKLGFTGKERQADEDEMLRLKMNKKLGFTSEERQIGRG